MTQDTTGRTGTGPVASVDHGCVNAQPLRPNQRPAPVRNRRPNHHGDGSSHHQSEFQQQHPLHMQQPQQQESQPSTRVWTHPSELRATATTGNDLYHRDSVPSQRRHIRPLHQQHHQQQQRNQRSSSRHPNHQCERYHHSPPPPPHQSSLTPSPQSVPPSSFPLLQQPPTWSTMKVLPSPPALKQPTTTRSGYLYKLGVNIPIYKRRFFTLPSFTPSLFLYYYISPHDREPRGCYNIFNATLEYDFHVNDDNDGETANAHGNMNTGGDVAESNRTYRFAIVWKDADQIDDTTATLSDPTSSNAPPAPPPHNEQRVELEARSKEDAVQWIRTIQKAQISALARERILKSQSTILSQTKQLVVLQRQLDNFKYMEQERDDAIQDAAQYQQQLQQLNENIQVFTRHVRRKQQHDDSAKESESNDAPTLMNTDDGEAVDKKDSTEKNKAQHDADSKNDHSKLDVALPVPSGNQDLVELYHIVEQLQEQVRSITIEANTATKCASTLNTQIQTLHHRNEQMEQHLCQIWEENCTLRKSMKQVKKEKRILVREIKSLRDGGNSTTAVNGSSNSHCSATCLNESKNFTEEFLNASDEDKLIQELEEHVLSSIRLHEEYLSSVPMTTTETTTQETLEVDPSVDTSADSFADPINDSPLSLDQRTATRNETRSLHPNVPLFDQHTAPIVSLFDNDDDEDSDVGDIDPIRDNGEFGNNGATDHDELETDITTPTTNTTTKKVNSKETKDDEEDEDELKDRPNPLLRLDDETNSNSEYVPSSVVSEQNRPTYQLSCPLTDAISTTTAAGTTNSDTNTYSIRRQVSLNDAMDGESLQVYHITFYSRTIGIQFQKVPPTPIKAQGLLTEAMTDDLTTSTTGTTNGVVGSSNTTAAELRRIAAISMSSKGNHPNSKARQPDTCDVATPVDAVLVCGFHGFDESNRTTNCPRPKLGARLVAFDGVSIEIGRWTFSAVRKAIQSCGRPLTLSFRNDYLTKEQRTILTKAVLDVDMASSSSTSSYRPSIEALPAPIVAKQGSSDPNVVHRHVDLKGPVPTVMTDDMSESAGGDSDYLHSFPQSFSGNRSVNSLAQYRSFYETRSYSSSSVGGGVGGSNKHKMIRSFSEAGGSATTTTTSSSVLSAIGPLVSNLLYRPRRPTEPFTPEYLRRAPEFVEETPQHQDFQSELL